MVILQSSTSCCFWSPPGKGSFLKVEKLPFEMDLYIISYRKCLERNNNKSKSNIKWFLGRLGELTYNPFTVLQNAWHSFLEGEGGKVNFPRNHLLG